MKVRTSIKYGETVDSVPVWADEYHVCQGYRCGDYAVWNRWAGWYCYSHAIRAGWVPGPVRRPGEQETLC